MSRIIIILSQPIFFRLLAHAPEYIQREARECARRAIRAFCLTEDDIREIFAQEEQWMEMSEESQKMAVQSLMDASEYDNAIKLANEAITEAIARYLHDLMIEKSNGRKGTIPSDKGNVQRQLDIRPYCLQQKSYFLR